MMNVVTLGKLIGVLLLSCLPLLHLLSVNVHKKVQGMNSLASCNGNHFSSASNLLQKHDSLTTSTQNV